MYGQRRTPMGGERRSCDEREVAALAEDTVSPHGPVCCQPQEVRQRRGQGPRRLCTKSPVRNLTHGSIRTFWSHFDGFSRPDRPILPLKSIAKGHFLCKAASTP
jgi:hypothetical protein